MNVHAQGGGEGESSNKKNKKKKKNKGQAVSDSSISGQQVDCAAPYTGPAGLPTTANYAGGTMGKTGPRPKHISHMQGSGHLLINVDKGTRNVTQFQRRDAQPSTSRSEGRQQRQGNADSAAKGGASGGGRYRDRGKVKTDRKSVRQSSDHPQDSSTTFKGKFVELEGKELLVQLAEHRIFELRKKNPSFPNAKYFCRLCEYHLDWPQDCERHVDEGRHRRKKEASDMEGILEHVPKPSPQQIRALDTVVESVVQQEGLSPSELSVRKELFNRLQAFIQHYDENLILHLYGSSFSGVGLKGSDVNIDVSGVGPAPALLMKAFSILQKHGGPEFVKVQSEFTAKIPVVMVTDSQTGCRVVMTINGQPAALTSKLLQLYTLADQRVQKLTVALRCWARGDDCEEVLYGEHGSFEQLLFLLTSQCCRLLVQICHLDRQEEGTLPHFAYHILVVYFLQHVQPPVLGFLPIPKNQTEGKGSHQEKSVDQVDFSSLKSVVEGWVTDNHSSVGELWLQLLKFYCLDFDNTQIVVSLQQSEPLTRQEKKWNSKKLAIEDPFNPKKNIANSLTNSLIFEYYQSCIRKAYEYFGMPRDEDGNVSVCLETLKALASKKTENLLKENQEAPTMSSSSSATSQQENDSSLSGRDSQGKERGKWEGGVSSDGIGMTRVSETDAEGNNGQPVTVPSNKSILQKLKAGTSEECTLGSSLAEDSAAWSAESSGPFESSAVLDSSGVSTPQLEECSISDLSTIATDSFVESVSEADPSVSVSSISELSECYITADGTTDLVDGESFVSAVDQSNVSGVSRPAVFDEKGGNSSAVEAEGPMGSLTKEISELAVSESRSQGQHPDCSDEAAVQKSVKEDRAVFRYQYAFAEDVFTGGNGPAVICGYCDQEGHIKANCPDDKLPIVTRLPPMVPNHLDLLDKVLVQIIHDYGPTEMHRRQRERVVAELEAFVRQVYPDAYFSLFGSSCNGFGFVWSDLDICMAFKGKTIEDIDVPEVIETVAKKLTQKTRLFNVLAIPTAKVPIVKFADRDTRLEGDISLYNTLAQRNTRLLQCYSEIDRRVKILGYAIKVFAKTCDIGDASRGSLSSYGYILMMLHYLQQCTPPVIPVLQELRPEGEWPEHVVESCNTWFFDKLQQLPGVWRDIGRNRQSVSALWLDFLCYYVERFDWKSMVITIRQKAPLSKFEKMWNGNNIAVEDPFDLSHNLGAGLSRKMNNFIYKTFVNGRLHFGTPFHLKRELLHRYRNPSDYFFDCELLTDGKPPNDRGCRLCGKIGHMVKDCPNRSQNKKRQQTPNEKDAREKKVQQDGSQHKKDGKETKGEGSSQAKVQGQETKGHGKETKEQLKDQQETTDQAKPQSTGQEKPKSPSDSVPRQEEKRNRSVNKGQGDSRQSRSFDDKLGLQGKRDPVSQRPVSHEASANGGTATTSKVITTTAASSPATLTSASRGSTPRTPPGFSSTPQRPKSYPYSPSQPAVPPAAVAVGSANPSQTHTSVPMSSAAAGSSMPGMQMDLQMLFSLAQQSGGNPVSLSPLKAHQSTKAQPLQGMPLSQMALTPEQQVAMFGAPSPQAAGRAQLTGDSARGSPGARMTPVSLNTLFQGQPVTSSSHQAPSFSTSAPVMPMPVRSLLPPHSPSHALSTSQQPIPPVSSMAFPTQPPRLHAPVSNPPQQMTPLSLASLFSSQAQMPVRGRGVPGTRPERPPMTPISLQTLFHPPSQAASQQQSQPGGQGAVSEESQAHQQQQQAQQYMQSLMLYMQGAKPPVHHPVQNPTTPPLPVQSSSSLHDPSTHNLPTSAGSPRPSHMFDSHPHSSNPQQYHSPRAALKPQQEGKEAEHSGQAQSQWQQEQFMQAFQQRIPAQNQPGPRAESHHQTSPNLQPVISQQHQGGDRQPCQPGSFQQHVQQEGLQAGQGPPAMTSLQQVHPQMSQQQQHAVSAPQQVFPFSSQMGPMASEQQMAFLLHQQQLLYQQQMAAQGMVVSPHAHLQMSGGAPRKDMHSASSSPDVPGHGSPSSTS